MSDAIKRAARERMAETGEKYTVARRKVIEEHARREAERAAIAVAIDGRDPGLASGTS
jgi:hypothetical protein